MFGEKYRERALEILATRTYGKVSIQLSKEFEDIPPPNEKTIRQWKKDKAERAKNKTATLEKQAIEAIKEAIDPQLTEHYKQLADIAKAMLRGIGFIQRLGNSYKCHGMENEKDAPYVMLSHRKLVDYLHCSMIAEFNENPVLARCLVEHFKAENTKYKDLVKFLEDAPDELVKYLQLVVNRKTLKGKCEICKDR